MDDGERTSDSADVRQLYEEARASWPSIELAFETFAARLSAGGRAHAPDLYLACACAEQHPAALAEFDRMFLRCVRDAVARIDRSHDFVAEVQQILRERLLVGPDAKIREYRGGGALASWIRTAAVRTALNLRRRTKQETKRGDAVEPFEQLLDPAIALLRQRHMPEIDAALRRAIAALDPKDRLLLHFYYVDGLTLAKIAALERVGTSTVFRRLNAATQAVLASVKNDLTDKLQLSSQSLDSLLGHVRDDIDLSLSQVLGTPE
ncbi:MAG: sigma-70 family RNA polymerase sigma factor [Myxococcales bacterium]|nr:sigma-70 family RNA polymerase sigma factor [Myxococcales bacterium]